MLLDTYRFWAFISLLLGISTIFLIWYVTWIGLLINSIGAIIFYFLREPYQQDPFNFQSAFNLARMGLVFNILGLFVSIVFTLISLRS